MISLVIPTAGFYRHNERLWEQIGEAQAEGIDLEAIFVVGGTIAPAFQAALSKAAITGHILTCGVPFRAGAAIAIGLAHASHETVVCMHDDIQVKEFTRLLAELKAGLKDTDIAVPVLEQSANPDQERATFRVGKTTHYIDRGCFAVRRSAFSEFLPGLGAFEIDGYGAAIQWNSATRGRTVNVVDCGTITHIGSATLGDMMTTEAYAEAFRRDMANLAGQMGVPVELDSRPAMPRILPKRAAYWEPYPISKGQEYLINEVDAVDFHYQGRTEPRIKLGDRFSIPSFMDKYELALVRHTGLGDALMATASLTLFKQKNPMVEIHVYANGISAEVMRKCPAVDKVFSVVDWRQIPVSAVDWSVANGSEGTPAFGFFALGLQYCSGSPMSISAARQVTPGEKPIGIQLHGGWKTKHWSKAIELGKRLIEGGNEVRFFGEHGDIPEELNRFSLAGKIGGLDGLIHEIGSLAAWVGFDSGPSYLANAIGIPTVWLFSTHDPRGLIGLCHTAAPYETIWRGWPVKCFEEHGISCRHPHQGGSCPLRTGLGANCVDDISVDEVIEKLKLITGATHVLK